MFFAEHEKMIYSPPDSDRKFDPLTLDRLIVVSSSGRISELIDIRNAPFEDKGDVSKEGKRKAEVDSASAELELARISRKVFQLPEFPQVCDAVALEWLYDFMDWMEKKGKRVNRPQGSTQPTDSQILEYSTTKNS